MSSLFDWFNWKWFPIGLSVFKDKTGDGFYIFLVNKSPEKAKPMC